MKNPKAFLDSYKKYINQGWFGGSFSTIDLDCWVDNFSCRSSNAEFDPIICAHFLLSSLVFYQDSHMEAIILSIENKIKSTIETILKLVYSFSLLIIFLSLLLILFYQY